MLVSSGAAQMGAHIHSAWLGRQVEQLRLMPGCESSNSRWGPSSLARGGQRSEPRIREGSPRTQQGHLCQGTSLPLEWPEIEKA